MTKVLNIAEALEPEGLAVRISEQFIDWSMRRQQWITEKEDIQRYVFATDTSKTANSALPWSNKTTIPKLCQIRDNLFANYMATMFPKRKNIVWEGDTAEDDEFDKSKAIEAYMTWVADRPEYYNEVAKLVLDYIDYGNAFVMPEWIDGRNMSTDGTRKQMGYAGPRLRRINPLDIVFNPTAPTFQDAPKIIRSVISLGEVKELLDRDAKTDQEREDGKKLLAYMKDLRSYVASQPGQDTTMDALYSIAGFDSFRDYLGSNTVEILTFYGDIYDEHSGEFLRNQVIKVVDRHKIISKQPNPSFFGSAPIYHVGWRVRPDNLWAMGPLDNLVGMQYRIDHLENMKADVWDLTRFPVFKTKGYIEDFRWAPGERVDCGDDGDVELLAPDVGALQANTEIAILEQKMEEMAGAPKEAMGFRSPGEKTKYEVQRIENAAGRIFNNKISQFEMHMVEPGNNAMLELARRNMDESVIRVFDDEFKITAFQSLTPEDITGSGRIRCIAARHFAEQAEMIQNLNNFMSSAAGQDPEVLVHFSTIKLSKMWEDLLDLEDYKIVEPYIRITERSDGQQLQNVAEEQMSMNTMTPSGMGTDYDPEAIVDEGPVAEQGPTGPTGTAPGQY